jgi:hypothetical protein
MILPLDLVVKICERRGEFRQRTRDGTEVEWANSWLTHAISTHSVCPPFGYIGGLLHCRGKKKQRRRGQESDRLQVSSNMMMRTNRINGGTPKSSRFLCRRYVDGDWLLLRFLSLPQLTLCCLSTAGLQPVIRSSDPPFCSGRGGGPNRLLCDTTNIKHIIRVRCTGLRDNAGRPIFDADQIKGLLLRRLHPGTRYFEQGRNNENVDPASSSPGWRAFQRRREPKGVLYQSHRNFLALKVCSKTEEFEKRQRKLTPLPPQYHNQMWRSLLTTVASYVVTPGDRVTRRNEKELTVVRRRTQEESGDDLNLPRTRRLRLRRTSFGWWWWPRRRRFRH